MFVDFFLLVLLMTWIVGINPFNKNTKYEKENHNPNPAKTQRSCCRHHNHLVSSHTGSCPRKINSALNSTKALQHKNFYPATRKRPQPDFVTKITAPEENHQNSTKALRNEHCHEQPNTLNLETEPCNDQVKHTPQSQYDPQKPVHVNNVLPLKRLLL